MLSINARCGGMFKQDQFGKLSEVLGGGREVELVSGAVRAA
jgi:hypothetical protein